MISGIALLVLFGARNLIWLLTCSRCSRAAAMLIPAFLLLTAALVLVLNLAHCLLPCSFHLMKMTAAIKSKCNVRTLVLFGALITRVRSLLQFLVELQDYWGLGWNNAWFRILIFVIVIIYTPHQEFLTIMYTKIAAKKVNDRLIFWSSVYPSMQFNCWH